MSEAVKPEQWYRVAEVQKLLGLGRSFLYEQMDAGHLRSVKVGGAKRISESALVEFQQRCVSGLAS
jgi:excisionase family DNA binding protein